MHVEVDQSGRIEFTKEHTVLAFSNGTRFTVLIPATVKRACITELRSRGLGGPTFYVRLFASALFFLLRQHIDELSEIVIDIEYLGNEASIKEHLLNLLRRDGREVGASKIHFRPIGKRSRAHTLALETFRGNRKPDLVLDEGSLLAQFRGKKKDRGLPSGR